MGKISGGILHYKIELNRTRNNQGLGSAGQNAFESRDFQ